MPEGEGAHGATYGRGVGWKLSANWVSMIVLSGLLLVAVNVFSTRPKLRVRGDWTSAGAYSIGERTQKILGDLQDDVEVVAFLRPDQSDQAYYSGLTQIQTQVIARTLALLKDYEVTSGGKVHVEVIDADVNPIQAKQRLLDLGLELTTDQVVVLRVGDQRKDVPLAELANIDAGSSYGPEASPARLVAFTAENALTGAIWTLTQEEPPKIYVVEGHDELPASRTDEAGGQQVLKTLRQDHYTVQTLPLAGTGGVPEDAAAVLILDPKKNFMEPELEGLRHYLEKGNGGRGGRLLVALDFQGTNSLDDFLRDYGFEVGQDLILWDPYRKSALSILGGAADPYFLQVAEYSPTHPVTAPLFERKVYSSFLLARAVTKPDRVPEGWVYSSLVETPFDAWETPIRDGKISRVFDPKVNQEGRRTIVRSGQHVSDDGTRQRMVVFGDADCFKNGLYLQSAGNQDLVRNIVAWLTERENLISIAPTAPEERKADLNDVQIGTIFYGGVVLPPLAAILVGLLVWTLRRDR